MSRVGILAGTGFSTELGQASLLEIDTPWGVVEVSHATREGVELFFVRRHGASHVAPHTIRHRANVEALARCGVDAIFAMNAVGAIDPDLPVPGLAIPDDFLDLKRTTETFHEQGAVHVDLTEAYCPALRALLARHAPDARPRGVYAAVEGPRLETRAEIRMMRAMGADMVGMTGCPEAALARERALCYASLCLVVNRAASDAAPLVAADIAAGAAALAPRALDVVLRAARDVRADRACRCRDALKGAALA